MTNEGAKEQLAELLADFDQQMGMIARVQRQRAMITGRATVRGQRVTVTVNVDGTVIDTRFGTDIADLSYGEIAKAMTEAAQLAVADATRQEQEVMAPLLAQRERMPKLHDLVEGMPDLRDRIPHEPTVSTEQPRGRRGFEEAAPDFTNIEQVVPRGGGVTDRGW
ncbi:YbaB/EbfC family nucleoid-associated protein [Nocardia sp. NPDC052566]|uniref:YbaB/EbfC family nucleoid-associated protein n=1 Tax=Nocardia sp. NPDC052566 TaxID=3364330 RepID=UPI0037C5B943